MFCLACDVSTYLRVRVYVMCFMLSCKMVMFSAIRLSVGSRVLLRIRGSLGLMGL